MKNTNYTPLITDSGFEIFAKWVQKEIQRGDESKLEQLEALGLLYRQLGGVLPKKNANADG